MISSSDAPFHRREAEQAGVIADADARSCASETAWLVEPHSPRPAPADDPSTLQPSSIAANSSTGLIETNVADRELRGVDPDSEAARHRRRDSTGSGRAGVVRSSLRLASSASGCAGMTVPSPIRRRMSEWIAV
jgi:hypothetical protein